MLEINDPKFRSLIERGIPLDRLEKRLKPRLGLNDDKEEKEHDGFIYYSHAGFLGKNEKLLEVIHQDWQVLEQYEISHEEIAKALDKAIKKRRISNKNYQCNFNTVTMGLQFCPWECEEEYNPGNMMGLIYHKSCNNEEIMDVLKHIIDDKQRPLDTETKIAVVTELHPHLIQAHFFFEGHDTPYRADPILLIDALKLRKFSK